MWMQMCDSSGVQEAVGAAEIQRLLGPESDALCAHGVGLQLDCVECEVEYRRQAAMSYAEMEFWAREDDVLNDTKTSVLCEHGVDFRFVCSQCDEAGGSAEKDAWLRSMATILDSHAMENS